MHEEADTEDQGHGPDDRDFDVVTVIRDRPTPRQADGDDPGYQGQKAGTSTLGVGLLARVGGHSAARAANGAGFIPAE
jgi:hypothetical protein